MSADIVNALTIDLEDYYMVSAFESVVKREGWSHHESRIERNTHRVLDILSEAKIRTPKTENLNSGPGAVNPEPGVKVTFFCLGWIAERYPHLIQEIDRRGHEIACHGYDHQLVYKITPEQFREDVRISKKILEGITGKVVIGYRAPSYSITEKSLWALRILAEEGYRYDSSIFPIHHDRYGIPTAPRFPFLVRLDGSLDESAAEPPDLSQMPPWNPRQDAPHGKFMVEYPISTVKFMGFNAPISGGGYMRMLPYAVIKKGLSQINTAEKHPFVVYLHPWELDPDQPRFQHLSILSRFRHYINLDGTVDKLKRLLNDFSFSSMENVIGLR
jgi:polysaccharide deacetylase family protein (PEP-CTERM system associated)